MRLLIAVTVGATGGLLGMKFGLPQGALLGSLLAVACLNISGVSQTGRLPAPLLFAMYVLIGVELGAGIDRKVITALGRAWLPAVGFVVALLLLTILASLIIVRFSSLDLPTALFGTSPGAISGITAMAADTGANVAVVVAIHTLRVTTLVFAMPWIYRVLSR